MNSRLYTVNIIKQTAIQQPTPKITLNCKRSMYTARCVWFSELLANKNVRDRVGHFNGNSDYFECHQHCDGYTQYIDEQIHYDYNPNLIAMANIQKRKKNLHKQLLCRIDAAHSKHMCDVFYSSIRTECPKCQFQFHCNMCILLCGRCYLQPPLIFFLIWLVFFSLFVPFQSLFYLLAMQFFCVWCVRSLNSRIHIGHSVNFPIPTSSLLISIIIGHINIFGIN